MDDAHVRNISDASVGTEELNHMEMICAMVYQLTRNLTPEQVKASGFDAYYVDHTVGLWPQAAGGLPQNAIEYQSKGDALTDLFEDLAADAAMAQKQPFSHKQAVCSCALGQESV